MGASAPPTKAPEQAKAEKEKVEAPKSTADPDIVEVRSFVCLAVGFGDVWCGCGRVCSDVGCGCGWSWGCV